MRMTRILVTGSGGAPTTNFVRSLRMVKEPWHFIGTDADPYYLQRSETDEKHLVTLPSDPNYFAIMMDVMKETKPDFIYAQHDNEIFVLSQHRDELPCRIFIPTHETIRICQDKYASFAKWKEAGLKVPETMMINDEKDLQNAFKNFGPRIWIRAIRGAFGKGSLPTENFDQAKAWLDFQKGWGSYSAAECLEPHSTTWQSIWKNGELIVAQGRKRLYWEFGNRAPSGVTGITGGAVTVSDPVVDDIAQKAIHAIDKKPHGIFSVDLTYDREGLPNPTEINIGRFFTTHLFFSAAGLNMPHIYTQIAMGKTFDPPKQKINPLPPGLIWIRGMDRDPVLTDEKKIENDRAAFEKRKNRLHIAS